MTELKISNAQYQRDHEDRFDCGSLTLKSGRYHGEGEMLLEINFQGESGNWHTFFAIGANEIDAIRRYCEMILVQREFKRLACLLDSDIGILDISDRSVKCLRTYEVNTVRQLVAKTKKQASGEMQLGKQGFLEVVDALEKIGLSLLDDPSTASDKTSTPDILNGRIHELDMTVRTENCLKKAGINTIGELVSMTWRNQVSDLPGIGKNSMMEIKQVLQNIGLSMNGSDRE